MRKIFLALSLVALAGIAGCNGEDEALKHELDDALAKIESMKKEVRSKEDELDEQINKNLKLSEELRELETAKEMGEVEIVNLKWDEKDRDFKLILRGTVKNTGRAYLYDVTIKVAITDATENIIVAPIVNDPDREEMEMLFFHNVADSLNKDGSKDFEMVIYTRNIHASGLGKVKEAIRQSSGPTTWEVTGLFNTAK
jgi:hypothetical protein